MTMDPIDFEFPQGKLSGRIRIDGRKSVAVTDLDMRLTNLGLQQFMPAKNGQPPADRGDGAGPRPAAWDRRHHP